MAEVIEDESLKEDLEIFKSSLFNSLGIDISNIGIKLISKILSGNKI